MEKEGLLRVLKFLDEMKLQVGLLHYYDVWHVAKGML